MTLNRPDRLFPADTYSRGLALELFEKIERLPIISPHGHCDPNWFSENKRFPDPAQLLVVPDHYVLRMLVSQGLSLNELGVQPLDGNFFENDPQKIWKNLAKITTCFVELQQQCGLIILLKKFLE